MSECTCRKVLVLWLIHTDQIGQWYDTNDSGLKNTAWTYLLLAALCTDSMSQSMKSVVIGNVSVGQYEWAVKLSP